GHVCYGIHRTINLILNINCPNYATITKHEPALRSGRG
ncbi:MAG: hypothetical protein UT11_C0028G0001, partial [Berkelbacteria bacterium GW2011_GWA2_38_9]